MLFLQDSLPQYAVVTFYVHRHYSHLFWLRYRLNNLQSPYNMVLTVYSLLCMLI